MTAADTLTIPNGLWLVIEASTAAGSIALLHTHSDGAPRLVTSRDVPMGSARDDVLTPALQSLLSDAGHALADVRAIVCGAGPGSFTSLRIAGALVKGLAYGLDVPVFAVPSMLLAARDVSDAPPAGVRAVAMDALRGESYVQSFRVSDNGMLEPATSVVRVATDEVVRLGTFLVISASSDTKPRAGVARWVRDWSAFGPVSLDTWEPAYGRLAEAQVKWEATHGRALVAD